LKSSKNDVPKHRSGISPYRKISPRLLEHVTDVIFVYAQSSECIRLMQNFVGKISNIKYNYNNSITKYSRT